jgi:hypothetical protein
MKTRSNFEGYCVLICVLTLPVLIYALAKVLLSTYYYLNPESSLHHSITIEVQVPMKFKMPSECELVQQAPEEHLAEQVRMYNNHLNDAARINLRVIETYSIFLVLLLLTFFGHLKLVSNINAKNNA